MRMSGSQSYPSIINSRQGYKDTRIKDTRIQGYKDTRIKDTRIQRYKDKGYKDTRLQGYKDTRILG